METDPMSGVSPPTQTGSWSDLFVPPYLPRVVLVSMAAWLHAADSLLVATMMPAIIGEIGGSSLIGWAFALYDIGSVVAGAAGGLLSIRFGPVRAMKYAALLYMAGCIISALAGRMEIMLFGRLLQGLGGGGLIALAFVSVNNLFPRHHMPRVMAAISAIWGTSAFFGPLVGGLFVAYSTWQGGFWFFAVQAALLAVCLAFYQRSTGEQGDREGAAPRFPIVRLGYLCGGVLAVAAAGIDVTPIRTIPLLVFAFFLFALFVQRDRDGGANRLFPRSPLDLRTKTGAGLVMIICFTIATTPIVAFGPVFMTKIHGVSALVAGYVIAASSIGWSLAAVTVSGLPERHDRKMIAAGMVLLTLCVAGFAWSVAYGPVWAIAVFALLDGAGFGICWTFILRVATANTDEHEGARIASAIPTLQRLGYAIGASYGGIVANASGITQALGGSGPQMMQYVSTTVFLACLPVAGFGLVSMLSFIRRRTESKSDAPASRA